MYVYVIGVHHYLQFVCIIISDCDFEICYQYYPYTIQNIVQNGHTFAHEMLIMSWPECDEQNVHIYAHKNMDTLF